MPATVTVAVPATTANLGPGFDCLGAALTLHNRFRFSWLAEGVTPLEILVQGKEADRVLTTAENLVYQAFTHFYQHIGQAPLPVQIAIELGIPLARGLGSSATAIVAGLVGANALAGSPLPVTEVMQLAIALEGHPDNVVPALLGGCRLAASGLESSWEICSIPWHVEVIPIVVIPDFELSTQAARRVLPSTYPRTDAIFNMAHLGLLLQGLATGEPDWLKAGLQDRIHQPYRQILIPGYEAVRSAALVAGAHGMVISGAGPTLLALADSIHAESVAAAMSNAWKAQGITAEASVLAVDLQGAIVT